MARPTNEQFAVAVHVLMLPAQRPDERMGSERRAGSTTTGA